MEALDTGCQDGVTWDEAVQKLTDCRYKIIARSCICTATIKQRIQPVDDYQWQKTKRLGRQTMLPEQLLWAVGESTQVELLTSRLRPFGFSHQRSSTRRMEVGNGVATMRTVLASLDVGGQHLSTRTHHKVQNCRTQESMEELEAVMDCTAETTMEPL
jgi:hypothetical protein